MKFLFWNKEKKKRSFPEEKHLSVSCMGEHELCVFCGKDTGVLKSAPIVNRQFFVPGCGQLCQACFYQMEKDELEQFWPLSEKENTYLREKAGK